MFTDRTKWNFAANRLSAALAEHRAKGGPLIDLTASNPTECGFDYDERAILQALNNPAALKYEPDAKGLQAARRAIAAYYEERNVLQQASECRSSLAEDILLTTSTSEAYSYVFRTICNPGEEVLVPEPSYPLFGILADIQDVKLAGYPLVYDYGWQIDFHALEKAITSRTKALIVVHPNNPTGHFCKSPEIAKLNEICASRSLALISDEVFLDFALMEQRPPSFAVNTAALTFTLSGLSKIAGLPQMKAAWLIVSGPEHLKKGALERLEIIADTYLSMNAPIQLAIPSFLAQREHFQRQLRMRVHSNLAELDRQLSTVKVCTRLETEGGWYAVLRIPVTGSDEDFAIALLQEENIYVHPGHFYDFPTEGYLIVSLITRADDFVEGIRGLLRSVQRNAST